MEEQLTIPGTIPTEHHVSVKIPDGELWDWLRAKTERMREIHGTHHIGEATVARAIMEQCRQLEVDLQAPALDVLVGGYLAHRRESNAVSRATKAAERRAEKQRARPTDGSVEKRLTALTNEVARLIEVVAHLAVKEEVKP
jgi:sugar diacid utilization regulator